MKKRILAIVLCAVMLLAFAGCSAGKSDAKAFYIGQWELSRVKYMGMEINMEDYVGEGENLVIEIKEDGTAVMVSDGEEDPATWKLTDKGFEVDDGSGEEPFQFEKQDSGELLWVLDADGSSSTEGEMEMYFSKK